MTKRERREKIRRQNLTEEDAAEKINGKTRHKVQKIKSKADQEMTAIFRKIKNNASQDASPISV